jgi:hypothetical protein
MYRPQAWRVMCHVMSRRNDVESPRIHPVECDCVSATDRPACDDRHAKSRGDSTVASQLLHSALSFQQSPLASHHLCLSTVNVLSHVPTQYPVRPGDDTLLVRNDSVSFPRSSLIFQLHLHHGCEYIALFLCVFPPHPSLLVLEPHPVLL